MAFHRGGAVYIRSNSVTLASADVNKLKTTPFTLASVSSATRIIVPVRLSVQYIFNSTPFTTAAQVINVLPRGGTGTADSFSAFPAAGFIDQSKSIIKTPSISGSADLTDAVGQDLVMQAASSDPSGGEGSLKVTISYYEIES